MMLYRTGGGGVFRQGPPGGGVFNTRVSGLGQLTWERIKGAFVDDDDEGAAQPQTMQPGTAQYEKMCSIPKGKFSHLTVWVQAALIGAGQKQLRADGIWGDKTCAAWWSATKQAVTEDAVRQLVQAPLECAIVTVPSCPKPKALRPTAKPKAPAPTPRAARAAVALGGGTAMLLGGGAALGLVLWMRRRKAA